jgi:hypothetical protein
MTTHAADLGGLNPVRAVRRDLVKLRMSVVIGATGAVGAITKDDAAWGITRSDTGDYSLTFPISAYGEPPTVKAVAAPAVHSIPELVTFSASAGTATITFVAIGGTTPTDPDEAAVLYVSVELDKGP